MWQHLTNFFVEKNGLYSIIMAVAIVLLLVVIRFLTMTSIRKDRVARIQAPELRDKFIILRDQYQVRIWKQLCDQSQVIVIGVHGLQGQNEDFKNLSKLCHQQKWSLISFDRRGAGKNFADFKFHSLQTDINDIKDVVTVVKTKFPKQKIILFGEALGASLASYATQNNPDVSGLITSNMITKHNMYPKSIGYGLRFLIGFLFSSNIKLPIYIEPKEISSNQSYITNLEQRYSLKQVWSLKYLLQVKKISQKTPSVIRRLPQASLIFHSADDVFSDFHELRIMNRRWKAHQTYHFSFTGKHALINEPEMPDLFINQIVPWVNNLKG